jgi:hypothetical protein
MEDVTARHVTVPPVKTRRGDCDALVEPGSGYTPIVIPAKAGTLPVIPETQGFRQFLTIAP